MEMPTTKPVRKPIIQASPKQDELDFASMSTDELLEHAKELQKETNAKMAAYQKPVTAEKLDAIMEDAKKVFGHPKAPIPAPEASIVDEINETKLRLRTINGGYKTFELLDILDINPDNLGDAFMDQASIFGYFSVLAAQADDAAARADANKDQEYAQADLEIREEAERNTKKLTEAQVKSLILTDAGYDKKLQQEHVTKLDARLLKAIVSALEMRANMLVSLGAMIRHEMDMQGIQVKERMMDSANDEIRKAARARKIVK
jgi:hypothetical protein